MRVRIALGMATFAAITSMGAVGYSAVNNGNRVQDVQRINVQQAKLIRANEIATTKAQKTSHAACLRTQRLAPPLLDFFASFNGTAHALPAKVLAEYRKTVPKTCPK